MRELPSSVARAVLWNDAMGNRAVVAMSCLIAACTLAEPGVPLGVPAAPAAPHVSVDGDPPALLTQRGDSARSGANAFERALSVSTVTPSTFGKLFTRAIDGDVYAQPLYVAGVAFADRTRNVLVVATEHDSVFAFDADDPSADAPLWKVTIGQATPVPNPWFAVPTDFDACRTATYNQRASGITSTPVIDPTTSTIYVVGLVQDRVATTTYADCVDVDPESDYRCLTSACDGPVFRVELHALDLVTGAERSGSPAVVGGSVLGNGDASENGVVTFDPRIHLQRPGLLLSGGRVYIGFGSYGDIGLYHGWIFAYDAATLARAAVFNSTPDGTAGSVWQSGVGLAADEDGYVYAVTGNGTFDADRGGRDDGDSVIKLDRDLNVVDWFTPYLASLNGTDYLSVWDADLGSGGVLLVAGTRKLAVAGKTGVLYLLDRDNLGHLEPPTGAGRSVERFVAWDPTHSCDGAGTPAGSGVYGAPVLWTGPAGPQLFVWGVRDVAKSFALVDGAVPAGATCFCPGNDTFPDDPSCGVVRSRGNEVAIGDVPGAMYTVSSNGIAPATGILWAVRAAEDVPTSSKIGAGKLEAYAAEDLTKKLWDSAAIPGDALGLFAKFTPPVVANGKVYVATISGTIVVYGLVDKGSAITGN